MVLSKRKQLALIILAVYIKKKKKESNERKRLWVREWIKKRETECIVKKLINELRNEDISAFKQFVRISPMQFDFLLEMIKPIITKKNTIMRYAIDPETRLYITLRFLATGEAFRSLCFLFRIPHNTISKIIPQTCEAIYCVLKETFLKVNI